jgi:hypothetical protein
VPVHDWSRVDANLFHDFRQAWTHAEGRLRLAPAAGSMKLFASGLFMECFIAVGSLRPPFIREHS